MTKTMPLLAHRDFGGEGRRPLVILHGLLGSSRNWQTAGRDLSERFHVCALDLRNHGESFHAREMDFPAMAADVVAWLDAHGIERAHLLGHSMGGKVAMRLACSQPERVGRLVVVDIAPKAYLPARDLNVEAIVKLEVDTLTSRRDAEDRLAPLVPAAAMRRFLLTNLERTPEGRFRWSVNLPAIAGFLRVLRDDSLRPEDHSDVEALFVLGGRSRAFLPGDEALATAHFPRARFVTIDDSGHNPHVETRERFVAEVTAFLEAP
jgi:esterase